MRFFNVKIIVLNLVVLLVLLNSINLFMNISGYGINQLHVKFIEDNVNSIVDLNQLNEDFISYSETEGITCLDVNDAAVNSSKYNKLIYDPSLYNYLGINQIHKDLLNGITGYNKLSNKPVTVVIFDNLIDFNHNNLSRMIVTNSAGYDEIEWYSAVGKIVLLNDDSALPLSEKFIEIDSSSITSSELYDQNGYKYFSKYSLYDYLYVDYYSHGTSVAGIINQIAPGAQIISVAYPPDNNDVNVFYESVINFLDWLEIKGEEYNIKVVNISNRWGSNTFGEFAQNQRDVIEGKIMDLAKPKELSGEYSMVFTLSAGNTINQEGQENLVYPSHIANNYESQLYNSLGNDVVIENHFDYENNPAIATGIISVSSIYDFNTILHPIGTRNNAYVYDQDKKDDSTDLKLMAPGFNITTTFNTRNKVTNEPIDKPFASFTGTSAATPCVAGLVALLFSIDPNLEAYEVEKILSENAIYDINVELEGDELQQKYGLGMINPLATLANYDSTLNDFDGDGLLDVDELYYYHTNASNADSDFDGLTDYEELFEGSDGYITDPWDADSDDDSLSDSEEKYYQTNPNDPDTDHDWIVDPEELIQGEDGYITCPTNGDTDGDYLPDGWEVLHGYSPVSQDSDGDGTLDLNEDEDGDGLTVIEELAYGTLDTDSDTDGDCIPDYDEIHYTESDPTDSDTDHDGLPDSWEVLYGLNPNLANGAADPDLDGLSNYEEYQLQLNPLNADSDGDGLPDDWELANDFDPLIPDAQSDPDNDDLTNLEEYIYDTDPNVADTDSDGMSDGWEILYSLNPLVADATADPDADGLTNGNEYLQGCNPLDDDSDNDGWVDGFEVYTSNTNPKKADSDSDGKTDKTEFLYWKSHGKSDATAYSYCTIADVDNDGLKDGFEIINGLDPLDNDMDDDGLLDGLEVQNYQTDPEDPDSDDDGYTDLYEVINGTDPNDPTDYPGGGGFQL